MKCISKAPMVKLTLHW